MTAAVTMWETIWQERRELGGSMITFKLTDEEARRILEDLAAYRALLGGKPEPVVDTVRRRLAWTVECIR